MADYDVLKFTNSRGTMVNFSDPPYMLDGHEGFGISEFTDTYVSPPGGHGAYWYDTRMDAKIVTVQFSLFEVGVIERENRRRDLVALLNPLLGPGILRLEQVNGVNRELRCMLSESLTMPTDGYKGSGGMSYTMRFKSDGIPAVYDPTIVTYPLSPSLSGNFTFPWSFPRSFAQSGVYSTPAVSNDGDIDTPIHVVLNGPLINPILRNNTTGEQLSLVGLTLVAGQQLVIDTDPRDLVVQINGVDAWQYINDAQFWMLAPGANSLLLDIGGTTVASTGAITWYSRYIGQ